MKDFVVVKFVSKFYNLYGVFMRCYDQNYILLDFYKSKRAAIKRQKAEIEQYMKNITCDD